MKKILLLLLLSGSTLLAAAQYHPVKFGLRAGGTYATLSGYSDGGAEYSTKYRPSFYAGATVEMQFSERFSLATGLSYVSKGAKATFDIGMEDFEEIEIDLNFSGSATLKLDYLELPVNAMFTLPSGDGSFILGGGPYFGYGIKAGSDITLKINGENIEDIEGAEVFEVGELKFGEGGLSRIDYGVNLTAGYRFWNGISINAGYGLGLNSILNDPDDPNTKVKNRHFSLGLAYSF